MDQIFTKIVPTDVENLNPLKCLENKLFFSVFYRITVLFPATKLKQKKTFNKCALFQQK